VLINVPLTRHVSVNLTCCMFSIFSLTSSARCFSVSKCSNSFSAPSTSPSSPSFSAFSVLSFIFTLSNSNTSLSALVLIITCARSRSTRALASPRSTRRSQSRTRLSNTAFVSELGFSFVAQRLKRRLDVVVPEFCKALRRHPTRDVAIAARVFKARNV
jgi:hypothetical protein